MAEFKINGTLGTKSIGNSFGVLLVKLGILGIEKLIGIIYIL
jgi:hypothetical protein